ncbi:conserved protein of unknown function [Magnetospirillum sp. XM-1]|uniref:hypothetical protein n=1 Tax=Magnetospirillum sp. XM-1 TaxID=1663591 RepID=UPI00073DB96F|nr:hypothetical protein [Magnetospirillum sp. XM-1]CUW41111.1 conserved protein of unknown function [Magnetospirillum sp. XM-1]
MPQHSHTFPRCQTCTLAADLCATCIAALPVACRDGIPAPDVVREPPPPLTRDAIAVAVLDAVAMYVTGHPALHLGMRPADLGLDGRNQACVELDLEERFGRPIPIEGDWATLGQLADLVALQLLPGEAGEVVEAPAQAGEPWPPVDEGFVSEPQTQPKRED